MSTIDIGIAETPALQPIRVAARKPSLMPVAPPVASTGGDFYVGSTKIDALPLQGTQPAAGQTKGSGV